MQRVIEKIDPFIFGLLLTVLTAFIFPYSSSFSNFDLSSVIYWGITGIFFLYGVKLNLRAIIEDLKNWKLHLLIQASTFILFPILILITYPLFKNTVYEDLWLACFFLGALPSTVSSSVVMVSIAKGNISSAIFNASISGLIGLLLTPLWMSFFLKKNASGVDPTSLIYELFLQILLPVILGVLFNKYLSKYVTKHKAKITWFDKIVIFLIVYKSFSAAFINKVFEELPLFTLILLFLALILLFFFVYFIILALTNRLHFNKKDKITALFCGSKKSLVHGSVFVTLLISDTTLQSLFLIPIMIYHSFQLFYISYLARKFSKK